MLWNDWKQRIKYAVYVLGILAKHRRTAKIKLIDGSLFVQVKANGQDLLVHPLDNGVGRPLYSGGTYEHDETCFLTKNLRPGMVFVDIGANLGYFTTLAARLVGNSGRVIAVEPDPDNFRLLELNVKRNGLTNVTALNRALGAAPGEATLFRSRWNFGDHRLADDKTSKRETVTVQVDTVDRIVDRENLPRVDLIKLDVQGFEQQVQKGMLKTLEANPAPVIITEFWPHGLSLAGGSAEDYYHCYTARGFQSRKLTGDGGELEMGWEQVLSALPAFDQRYPESSYLNMVFRKGTTSC